MSLRFSTRLTGFASNLGWLLAPLLLIQGYRVRKQIVRVPEADGKRVGEVAGDGADIGLLVLGDSTAAGVGAHSQDNALGNRGAQSLHQLTRRTVRWQVVGRNGYRVADVRKSLKALLPEAGVDIVVVTVGVNDVTRWTRQRQFLCQTQALLNEIEQRFDSPLVLFSGLPPVHKFPALPTPLRQVVGLRARFIDRVLRDSLAGRDNARHVPLRFDDDPALFCADGFHPGVAAYRIWADELARQAVAAGHRQRDRDIPRR